MFYIGDWDKQKVVSHYIENNDVRKILVIYNPTCKTEYSAGTIRAKHIFDTINSMPSEFIEESNNTQFTENNKFLCRNLRFKKLNCTTYKEDENNTIIDFPIRRQELISLLTRTREKDLTVTTSDLSIDRWQKKDLEDWINRLEKFYAETALS